MPPTQIREKLNERFAESYLKKTYPNQPAPENDLRVQEFTSNREAFVNKLMTYQDYDKRVAEKEKQLARNPDLKVRSEVQKDIWNDPKSSWSLKNRATWIPEGENFTKGRLPFTLGHGAMTGFMSALGGALGYSVGLVLRDTATRFPARYLTSIGKTLGRSGRLFPWLPLC